MSAEGVEETRPVLLLRFIDRFDRGEYWLAHEELEELWLELREDFFKGLIHLAAALVHVQRGNWRGAVTKTRSAVEYLQAPSGDEFAGFRLAALRRQATALLEHLRELQAGKASEFDESRRPELRPLFDGTVPDGIAAPEEVPYRVRRYEKGYRLGRDPRKRD